jgi:hypothetical protein
VNRGLVFEGDDPKVAIPEFRDSRPESKTIALLALDAHRLFNYCDAPFTTQIRALSEDLRLEVISELVFGHARKVRLHTASSVTNVLRELTELRSAAGHDHGCGQRTK